MQVKFIGGRHGDKAVKAGCFWGKKKTPQYKQTSIVIIDKNKNKKKGQKAIDEYVATDGRF